MKIEDMMNLRLIVLVANGEYSNNVISLITSHEGVVWIGFPGKCIRVNTAVHEKPFIGPVGWNGCLILGVNCQVKAEVSPGLNVFTQKVFVLGHSQPGWLRNGNCRDSLVIEAFEQLLIGRR